MQEWCLKVAFEFNVVAMSSRKCNLKGSVYQRQSSEAKPNTLLFARLAHITCLSPTKIKLCVIQSYRKHKRSKPCWGCTLPLLTTVFQFFTA